MTPEQLTMIENCMEQEEKLNDWEKNFIIDLYEKSDSYILSPEQNFKLQNIVQTLEI